jgi:mono/diheme cytochrome c family protein
MLTAVAGFAQTASTKPKTVWDGVFNEAQAKRGETAYNSFCSGCHGRDLTGLGSVLSGDKFLERWREDNLSSLFQLIGNTMPPGPRGRVTDAEYIDVLAYILKMNQFPAGTTELAPSELKQILVVRKDGPKPVPDFALVTVVGCLARDEAKVWMLTNASEPVRTRNPRESTEAELAVAKTRVPGNHTFHFLDASEFAAEFRDGRWVEAKGFLIRSPGNDRMNLTWLKGLKETCEGQH